MEIKEFILKTIATISNNPLVITWMVILLIILYFILNNWHKRRLYYYGSKFPGPLSLPGMGSLVALRTKPEEIHKKTLKLFKSQPPTFRIWIGSDLYIVTSQPEYVKILLPKFLERPSFFELSEEKNEDNTVLSAPARIRKKHRKVLDHDSNAEIMKMFFQEVVKYLKNVISLIESVCDKEIDGEKLALKIEKCALDTALETLAGVDFLKPSQDRNQISWFCRSEDVMTKKLQKFWLLNDSIWKFSRLIDSNNQTHSNFQNYYKMMTNLQENKKLIDRDNSGIKYLSEYLINLSNQNEQISKNQKENEKVIMFLAAVDTVISTLNSAILILGLYPEIQEKIFCECSSQFKKSETFTLEGINKMDYLERVIKETMRLFPETPVVLGTIEKNVQIGSYICPRGSIGVVPVAHLHRRSDLWSQPLNFEPDRFLRHPCAFIPFSFATRNYISITYAMLLLKVVLAGIVLKFTVKPADYGSLEDIDFYLNATPRRCNVIFEKRV